MGKRPNQSLRDMWGCEERAEPVKSFLFNSHCNPFPNGIYFSAINYFKVVINKKLYKSLSNFDLRKAMGQREAIVNSIDGKTLGMLNELGGVEHVLNLLERTIFKDYEKRLKLIFESEFGKVIASTVGRYFLLDYLISEGHLDRKNLEGEALDIGSYLGATVDAIAMYGGKVIGTDNDGHTPQSLSGRPILYMEGITFVKEGCRGMPISLITCFNADWVEKMSSRGWALQFYQAALERLQIGGQVLLTFRENPLISSSYGKFIRLPERFCSKESLVYIGSKN